MKRFTYFLLVFSLLILCIIMSGCASVVKGSKQEMSFQSNPEGATVEISGRIIGRTPVTTTIDKKDDQILIFSKDGYKDQKMQLTTTTTGWFFGNIISGLLGLLGSTVDFASGAMIEYMPSQYYVTLAPKDGTAVNPVTSEKGRIKEFVVVNYSNLMKELAQGPGENITTLLEMLGIKSDKQQTAIAQLKALAEIYKDIPSYADRVLDLYVERPAPNSGGK
jgi:hypothetical protein